LSEKEELERAITAVEAQRANLGEAATETALAALRRQLAELETLQSGSSSSSGAAGTPADTEAERRIVTILFSDVTGSTALAEQMDPEAWSEIMNEAFENLIEPIERFGGTVARLMGDAILAFFGAPLAHEDDPQRAVLAGLAILENIEPFRQRLQHEQGLNFNMRVGINTGLTVVGDVGSDQYGEYTALGDAVNLAARMEQTAEPGTVQIAEDTYKLVAPLFDCRPLGDIEVKGKAGPVPAYRVLGRKAEPGRLRGLESRGINSPVVGRDAEYAKLVENLEALLDGQGGITFIIGEAGLGKSRLLSELRSGVESRESRVESGEYGDRDRDREKSREPRVESHQRPATSGRPPAASYRTPAPSDRTVVPSDQQPAQAPAPSSQFAIHNSQLTILEGQAMSFGQSISYWPFQQILWQFAGINEEDDEAEVWSKLEKRVYALFQEETDEIVPYLASLLGLEVKAAYRERVKYLDAESMGRQLYRASRLLFERLAQSRPLLLVFEDLHWADESSAQLLERLLPLVESVPLLILGVSRPEPDAPAARLHSLAVQQFAKRTSEIVLSPLSQSDSTVLVRNLLAVEDLTAGAREMIVGKADGNPFFLEEIIRTLIDAGAIVHNPESGRWRATALVETVTIPDTIQGVIMARVDRLDEDVKQVLRAAAVIGRSFLYRVLQAVTAADAQLDGYIGRLQEIELVHEKQGQPELEYMFRHALAQEATYESILLQKRRALHASVGQAIETLFADRLEEFYSLLAYHYARAEAWEKAQEYLFKAGDQAGRVAADGEALEHYRQALAAYERAYGDNWQPLQRARLERKLGEAFHRRGQDEEARAYLERALAVLGRPLPQSRWGVRWVLLREITRQIGYQLLPGLFLRKATPISEQYLESQAATIPLVWINIFLARLDVVLLIGVRSLNHAQQRQYLTGVSMAGVSLGTAADFAAQTSLARRYHHLAVEAAEKQGEPDVLGFAYQGMASHAYRLGEKGRVVEYARRSAEAHQSTGHLRGLAVVWQLEALANDYTGELTEAMHKADEVFEMGQAAADPYIIAVGEYTRGRVYQRLGQLGASIDHIEVAAKLADDLKDHVQRVEARAELGRSYVQQGQISQALASFDRAESVAREFGVRGWIFTPLRNGRVEAYLQLAEEHDGSEGDKWLNAAGKACKAALKQGRDFRPGMPEAMRLRGTYDWLAGNAAAAEKWWRRSLDEAEAIEQPYDTAMTLREMGQRLEDPSYTRRAAALLE
jgi:class 3 adenylate cyclase/tetratricopeptide (TPR) repeat protein